MKRDMNWLVFTLDIHFTYAFNQVLLTISEYLMNAEERIDTPDIPTTKILSLESLPQMHRTAHRTSALLHVHSKLVGGKHGNL